MSIVVVSNLNDYESDEAIGEVIVHLSNDYNVVVRGGAILLRFDTEEDDPGSEEATLVLAWLQEDVPGLVVSDVTTDDDWQTSNEVPA